MAILCPYLVILATFNHNDQLEQVLLLKCLYISRRQFCSVKLLVNFPDIFLEKELMTVCKLFYIVV